MNSDLVTVIREGKPYNIHEIDLRKGDLVLVQTGDVIPADLKLIEARLLEVDEFDITGELTPVYKTVTDEDVFLYMGSRVVRGSAKGIVVALKDDTEYGRIIAPPTLVDKLCWTQIFHRDQLTVLLILIPALCISLLRSHNLLGTVFSFLLIGILMFFLQSDSLFQYLFFYYGSTQIKKHNILIRNFDIFGIMDHVDIICFDKTGVLTTRNIEVTKIFLGSPLIEIIIRDQDLNNSLPALIKIGCSLCTDVSFHEKITFANPVDHALISFAQKMGVDFKEIYKKYKQIYDMPFNSENRFMCCGYETDNQDKWYFLKGDPDIVLTKCRNYYSENGEINKIDFDLQSEIKAMTNTISQNGDTAIALAIAETESCIEQSEFTFLCLVQIENTLQKGAKEVVQKAIEKGMRPLLLTGDKQQAAIKIAHDCGIASKSSVALNGNVMERMALDEVGRQSEYCSIFSRLMPSQKGSIIRQLQFRGHRIAMIGDGPNDGIALRVADVGISFQANSSPIAMQYSSVLLSQLSDLAIFIDISNKVMRIAKRIKLLRALALLILLILVYLNIFLQIY